MDGVILGIAIMVLPLMAIGGFVLALEARGRLKRLEARLAALEGAPAGAAPLPETTSEVEPAADAAAEPEAGPEAVTEPGSDSEPDAALAPAGPKPSFEERFGTRWVVWVGGLALALGGIFMVRYSIEAGLLGPGARVALGALLAVVLIAAGEWTRRRELASGLLGISSAHIPSILTAAGTTVAYAVVFAAYGLYGMLAPAAAFVLLGLVAVATLAAALLHGPALAALGMVGAYLAPLLVSTSEPNWWALAIYLVVVTGATFALALVRLWRWLAITAVVLSALWALPGVLAGGTAMAPVIVQLAGCLVLAAALIVAGLLYGPPAEPGRIDAISSGAIATYVVAGALLVLASGHDTLALAGFGLLVAATLAVAWRADASAAAVPAAALMTALVMADWAVKAPVGQLLVESDMVRLEVDPARRPVTGHLVVGGLFAALFGLAGLLRQGGSPRAVPAMLWAGSAVAAPVAILLALYWRVGDHTHSYSFAALALIGGALYALASDRLQRRPHRPGLAAGVAIFAVGGVAGLALALTFALEKGWLTVGLALMVPGIAWIAEKRPVPALRWLAAVMVAVLAARTAWQPTVADDLGTTPILNWLLWGYGVPAAAFWWSGWRLRKRADDIPARMVESGAILFTVLTVFVEIRHYIHAGDIYAGTAGLTEVALQVNAILAVAIGLEWVRGRTGSIVHNVAAAILTAMAMVGIVGGLLLFDNPWLTGRRIDGAVINLILLGYLLPGILAGVLAVLTRPTRPAWARGIVAGVAVLLGFAYLSLQVMRLFGGPYLSDNADTTLYALSVAWLGYGVALLLGGLLLGSQPARLASAIVLLVTIAKVFLVDMGDLEGAYRALSFIGLGAVLVGIGWLYQRLLFRKAPPTASESTR
ncbi:MAG: DUF2339 domain-containing protein [Alphaproteobacteria bacterium]